MPDKVPYPVSGLHHRIAYVDSTLRHALRSITAVAQSMDEDRRADGGMAAELYNLDRALSNLEKHMRKLTPKNEYYISDSEVKPDASTAVAERELLIQALDAQEHRIRLLEEKLAAFSNDDNRLVNNSSRDLNKEVADVITNDSLKDDPYAQRMIVTIQDEGNLKIALNSDITTLGREPANDVQIRSRFVSRYHARIVNDESGACIEDLDSRNGVSVNAERISRKKLRSGDFIKIGRMQLQYIDIMEGSFDGGAA